MHTQKEEVVTAMQQLAARSGKMLALLATLATIWGVAYMHDRAHRYDIVAVGAGSGGSGGSQENTGDVGTTE
jgi:hypothetical protein